MFIRKKKNRSGSTSVVVVDKSRKSFKELVTIGISSDNSEIELLCQEGQKWIKTHCGNLDFLIKLQENKKRNK